MFWAIFMQILKGNYKGKVKAYLTAGFFLCTGALMLGLGLLGYDKLSSVIMISTIGCIAMFISVCEIIQIVKCSLKVQGQFLGVKSKPEKGATRYRTKFSYEINGQTYKSNSIDAFSRRYVKRKYEDGKKYYIYVNPKNPKDFLNRRMLVPDTVFVLAGGIMFIVIACVYLIKIA